MIWTPLTHYQNEVIPRGALLKFITPTNVDNEQVLMVCEEAGTSGAGKGLISITGYKAGITYYVVFPCEAIENGLQKSWLIKNWSRWVCADCDIRDVLICDNFRATFLNI
jgi:Immunity protein 45